MSMGRALANCKAVARLTHMGRSPTAGEGRGSGAGGGAVVIWRGLGGSSPFWADATRDPVAARTTRTVRNARAGRPRRCGLDNIVPLVRSRCGADGKSDLR